MQWKWRLPDDSEALSVFKTLDPRVADLLRTVTEEATARWSNQAAVNFCLDGTDDEQFSDRVWDHYAAEFRRLACEVIKGCESPPEQLLALELQRAILESEQDFHVINQYLVRTERGEYRLDFVVDYWPVSDVEITVGVECDGHQWHDRTPQQAARDKSRDRSLAEKGFPILRFTASEIMRDGSGCSNEVLNVLRGMWRHAQYIGEVFAVRIVLRLTTKSLDTDS